MDLKKYLPAFILGFLALSFQIILIREFSVHFYGNEITIGILLSFWLLWTGLGSLAASRIKFSLIKFVRLYFLVIIIFPICLIGLRLSRFALNTLPGEITGLTYIILFSMGFSFFICFPLGILFVFNTYYLKGNLSRVYMIESLGSAIAGSLVYFILIPLFSNWQVAILVAGLSAIIIFLIFRKKRNPILLIFSLILFFLFWALDFPTQKIFWSPFNLIASKDSPYGKLQVLKDKEQISLYNNCFLIYSNPDKASSEESVHFALLQNPEAKNVLLIGGGAGGSLKEILKYPNSSIDYVELDPEIIRFSKKFLPAEESRIFENPRINTYFKDGRLFLNNTQKDYDVIILNLPDPITAQINRFYTEEFFLTVKAKLSKKGIFSFRTSSAENYISPELQDYLSSLYRTLKKTFPFVEIVPGAANIFLASSQPITLEYEEISQEIEKLKLNNVYINPQLLFSRLSPLRKDFLKQKILEGEGKINQDLKPISYFFSSVLWSTQFKGLETSLLAFLSRSGKFWILDLPLILFLLFLTTAGLKRSRKSFYLIPLFVMGLSSITIEIILILAFQTFHGYIYQGLALLFSFFMLGLCLGAFSGIRKKNPRLSDLLLIQFVFLIFIFLLLTALQQQIPLFLFFVFLLLFGAACGHLFVISNRLFLQKSSNYGLGYGLDLLGSFLGALAVSSVLIPLVGLQMLTKYLFLINSFTLLFLAWGTLKPIGSRQ